MLRQSDSTQMIGSSRGRNAYENSDRKKLSSQTADKVAQLRMHHFLSATNVSTEEASEVSYRGRLGSSNSSGGKHGSYEGAK